MKIKNRLSLYFTAISALVLLIVQIITCVAFSSFIKTDFYDHLMDRANVAAKLYLEADEISPDSLSHVREHYLQSLPSEVVRLYDEKNAASFIKDKDQFWTNRVINSVRKHKELEFTEGNRQTVGIYYNDNQGNFVILVSAIDDLGNKRLKDLIGIMSVVFVLVTFGLFVISRWFAEKSLQPIDKLVGEMQQVRAGNLSLRVDEGNGKDEISALAQNFNKLLGHLENAFELQQTFVVNSSHELRTPITSIIGEIEITLVKLRSAQEYEQVLRSVLTDADRLNDTIGSLLELANLDMSYMQAAFKPVAIDELIWELNDYWASRLGKGMLNINILQMPEDHDDLLIIANRSLLMIALNNIIGNAFKFSQNKKVACDLYADGKTITITITDNGIGIMPNELDKIFDSFYRGTNVKNYNGSGIGLFITNKVISLFNGTIKVTSVPGSTSVCISFSK